MSRFIFHICNASPARCSAHTTGFGDLLIGAGVLMYEANGLDASLHGHVRNAMVDLIKIVEGFFACGVAASVYGLKDGSGNIQPDSVFSNVGKLLLATQISRHPTPCPLRLGRSRCGVARPR